MEYAPSAADGAAVPLMAFLIVIKMPLVALLDVVVVAVVVENDIIGPLCSTD